MDDQPAIRALLEEVLKDEFEVQCSSSGEQAIELTKSFKPDIVLLDIGLKTMSGIEALPRIKAIVPDSAIVMLTGSTSPSTMKEALSLGASGYMQKPFDILKIKSNLKNIVLGKTAI